MCKDVLTKLADFDFINFTEKYKLLKFFYILFPFAVIYFGPSLDKNTNIILFKIFLFVGLLNIPSSAKHALVKMTDRLSLKIACFLIICGIAVLIFMNIAIWFAI